MRPIGGLLFWQFGDERGARAPSALPEKSCKMAAVKASLPRDLPRHPLHHLVDRQVRGVDEGVGAVPGERRIGTGAVAQVATADLLEDLVEGDGVAGGGQLVEAAPAAHVGAGLEEEL